MGKCCQLVMGPAGSGKSTYCKTIQEHCENIKRTVHVVNLDPAAENFGYRVAFDIRELVSLQDVMEELEFGPNGGLVYCMEYLLENIDWLKDELDNYDDDEYLIFDCPGQVELYSHIPVMKEVLDHLKMWGYNICGVFLVDALIIADPMKVISGTLLSLSAMVQLELPHVNVLSKCDLVEKETLDFFLDEDRHSMADYIGDVAPQAKASKLTNAICSVVDDFTMVSFVPFNISDEDTITLCLAHIDQTIQYGEDLEPKEPKYDDEDFEENDTENTDADWFIG